MKSNVIKVIAPAALGCLLAICGCATNGAPKPASDASAGDLSLTPPSSARFPGIALEAGAHQTLGEAFRHIGETYGGGAALVGGLEDRPAPAEGLRQTGFLSGMEKLAAPNGCKVQRTPHYVFVYPEGYESLAALSLQDQVPPHFNALTASFAVGAGTDLFNALALLGNTLEVTVVADNVVADAWCGEVFLENAPLTAILEALLKSARIPPQLIAVESTDAYIFIRSNANAGGAAPCLNLEQLSGADRALLEAPVVVRLPDASPQMTFQPGPTPFAEILPVLSGQIGMPVTAESAMMRLPVNAAAFHGVSVQDTLDLIVRQWPIPRYGYVVESGGVLFRERPQP